MQMQKTSKVELAGSVVERSTAIAPEALQTYVDSGERIVFLAANVFVNTNYGGEGFN